ncbi:MAG: DUF4276 family protein [Planctomycetales bacterium]
MAAGFGGRDTVVSAKLFVEGGATGPDSKLLQSRCREGVRKLLEKCGFTRRMPKIVACGGRGATYRDFSTAHANAPQGAFVAMLIDSEDPVSDIDATWMHLKRRDRWEEPPGATDEQVLMMTTCMESWIVTDRTALENHYGADLQESALPSLQSLESRSRDSVLDSLQRATRNCQNAYQKGKRSFEIFGMLSPDNLLPHLPSFSRCERILGERL